jgi:hypothetical protein
MSAIRATVRALLAREPELTNRQIIERTGFTRTQVKDARWFLANPERASRLKVRYYRSIGVRPEALAVAERRAEAAKRTTPVLRLRQEAKSFSQIATELRLTRNQVAGRVRRARRTSMVQVAPIRDRQPSAFP